MYVLDTDTFIFKHFTYKQTKSYDISNYKETRKY